MEEFDNSNGLKKVNSTGSFYLSSSIKADLPDSVDWREKGAVTEVKDQDICGSCYAFSSAGALEGQIFRKTGKLINLSEQQIVDCDSLDDGCEGGTMSSVYEYIKNAGGIESYEDYPYVSGKNNLPNDKCYFKKDKVVAIDTGYVELPPGNEEKLKGALATVGPISVAITALKSLKQYKGGIYHDPACDIKNLNHGVLLVGYGTDKLTGTPYWLIKNSWGHKWGENGYFRMPRNIGSCNLGSYSVYPLV